MLITPVEEFSHWGARAEQGVSLLCDEIRLLSRVFSESEEDLNIEYFLSMNEYSLFEYELFNIRLWMDMGKSIEFTQILLIMQSQCQEREKW